MHHTLFQQHFNQSRESWYTDKLCCVKPLNLPSKTRHLCRGKMVLQPSVKQPSPRRPSPRRLSSPATECLAVQWSSSAPVTETFLKCLSVLAGHWSCPWVLMCRLIEELNDWLALFFTSILTFRQIQRHEGIVKWWQYHNETMSSWYNYMSLSYKMLQLENHHVSMCVLKKFHFQYQDQKQFYSVADESLCPTFAVPAKCWT